MKKVFLFVMIVSVLLSFTACSNDKLITMDEFNDIENGMSYDKVCDIIGSEGELASETSIAGYETAIYTWKGAGSVGANANVTFQNDKVCSKAQAGLR